MGSIVGNVLGDIVGEILGLRSVHTTTDTLLSGTTLDALQAGSAHIKYVVAIEGYKYLLSDALPAKVIAAWQTTASGIDWESSSQVLGGLFVELDNQQKADPWDPFQGGGTCKLYVVDEDGTDQFGIDTHKAATSAETQITQTVQRDDTSIAVKNAGRFLNAPNDAFIGTECVTYSSKTATTMELARRGKYTPFHAAGETIVRYYAKDNSSVYRERRVQAHEWAQQHRVGYFDYATQLEPVISQHARVWAGKWVGVWMHIVDGDGNLNSKDNAQCVFAGKISEIQDDPETGSTIVTLRHVLDTVKDATVGRDMFRATIAEGVYLREGDAFSFSDFYYTSSTAVLAKSANALVVVASGASDANHMDAGYYTLAQLTGTMNTWLASEKAANRIRGTYTFTSPEQTPAGLRTIVHWSIVAGVAASHAWFDIYIPKPAALLFGWIDETPQSIDATARSFFEFGGLESAAHADWPANAVVPYRNIVFENKGGSLNQQMQLTAVTGAFADQWDEMPGSFKTGTPAATQGTYGWGVFILDGKSLMVGAVAAGELTAPTELQWCWPIESLVTGKPETSSDFFSYARRADETDAGPIEVRQVAMMEMSFGAAIKRLFYGSGLDSYNDPDYDNAPAGWSIGIPGVLLGQGFEDSIDALTASDASTLLIFDAPIKLSELIGAELTLRGAYPVFINGHIEFRSWQHPSASRAVATFDETNKAEATGVSADHRSITTLTDAFQRNIVKILYNRDISSNGTAGSYRDKYIIEDRVSVDDCGEGHVQTIEARNTYLSYQATGAGVDAMVPNFTAMMPLFSRAQQTMRRSMDMRFFEGITVGDIALVSDPFARDPSTGIRSVSSRPAIIVSHRWSPGGRIPGQDEPQPPAGEVELFFFGVGDLDSYTLTPSARVDETADSAGFASGYNSSTHTLRFRANEYSEASEGVDASFFIAGDKILIVEIDPDDPTAPTYWRRTVSSVSGNDIVLTAALSSPSWDDTKYYMITYDTYLSCEADQQGKAFQAADDDGEIQDDIGADQWASQADILLTVPTSHTDLPQRHSTLAYGDGQPLDVGYAKGLSRTIENLIDHKTAINSPIMWHEAQTSGIGDATYGLVAVVPIFLQPAKLSNSVLRYLHVYPMFKSDDGSSMSVRVSLCRTPPQDASTFDVTIPSPNQQETWSTTSTSYVIGEEMSFLINLKNDDGIAWLIVEATEGCWTLGLPYCAVGERVIA